MSTLWGYVIATFCGPWGFDISWAVMCVPQPIARDLKLHYRPRNVQYFKKIHTQTPEDYLSVEAFQMGI